MQTKVEAMREQAAGLLCDEAAVELLIRTGLADRVDDLDPDRLLTAAEPWSGGQRRIAALAASLLGGPPAHLSEVLPGLDRATVAVVLAAVAHAAGAHTVGVELGTYADGQPGLVEVPPVCPWP